MNMEEFHLGGGTVSLETFLAEAREELDTIRDGSTVRLAVPCMIYFDVYKDDFDHVVNLLETIDEGTRIDFVEEAGPFKFAVLYPGLKDEVVTVEDSYINPDL